MSWLSIPFVLVGVAHGQSGGPAFGPLDAQRPIPAVDAVYLPEMTWMEVRDARDAGARTVIVPTGGIEQNGPFLVLGKHDRIAREVAERAARRLGDALVAPVISFVPEGSVRPPMGHMKYPGTISVRPGTFERILEDSVRSLAAHGFENIVLVGDSGDNQAGQIAVAERLDGKVARVHHIEAFYDPQGANAFLEGRGLTWSPDLHHDDPGFTLQLAAIDPDAARIPQRLSSGVLETDGFSLEPLDARLELGNELLDWRAERTAVAIREARDLPTRSRLDDVQDAVLVPFTALARPDERIFGFYLVTALLMGFLVEAWREGRDWSVGSVGRALFPRDVWLSRDSLHDLLFSVLGGVFAFGWFGGAWPAIIEYGRSTSTRLLSLTGIDNLGLEMGLPLILLATVVTAVAVDFAVYVAHWAQHRIPVLWAFHKVHHAARHLTPLTLFRQHPVDLLLGGVLGSLFSGLVVGLLAWMSPSPPTSMQFYGLNVIVFVFYVAGYNLRHTHVWLSFGPLERLIVSPAMHQIHHSEAERHWDRNLGLTFSVWDQIFGTAYIPEGKEELKFGIGPESERFRTFLDFYIEPFREVLGMEMPTPSGPVSDGDAHPDRGDGREPSPPPSRPESP